MILPVDGALQTFAPLASFRAAHGLPPDFGVGTFQPKPWEGLGSLEQAGAHLRPLHERTVAAVPASVPATDWLYRLSGVVEVFEAELRAANVNIGLREEEIAFAVNGFSHMCTALAYALARAHLTAGAQPTFDAVYRQWLHDSVTVGSTEYEYTHHGQLWRVQVISHIYGRVGLVVHAPTETHYLMDKSLACPAEGFMHNLLRAVAERIIAHTR